jgi:predicted nucleic acid-binding protein
LILADSSAWIAFLRGSGTPSHHHVRELAGTGQLASTETILMEVLAGARSEQHAAGVRRLLLDNEVLTLSLPDDAETAAAIYRTCRRRGTTIRKLNDCLIAAVAIRHGVPLLHEDRDFEAIAQHTSLETFTS